MDRVYRKGPFLIINDGNAQYVFSNNPSGGGGTAWYFFHARVLDRYSVVYGAFYETGSVFFIDSVSGANLISWFPSYKFSEDRAWLIVWGYNYDESGPTVQLFSLNHKGFTKEFSDMFAHLENDSYGSDYLDFQRIEWISSTEISLTFDDRIPECAGKSVTLKKTDSGWAYEYPDDLDDRFRDSEISP